MRVCDLCGKVFDESVYDMTNYAYKRGSMRFCSYPCMRKFDKMREASKEKVEMHFVAVKLGEWTAKGKFGRYTIKFVKHRGFWTVYKGFDNKRTKLGWKQSIDEAVDACMDDENWEWTE